MEYCLRIWGEIRVILCRKNAWHVEKLLGKKPWASRSSLRPCSGGMAYLKHTVVVSRGELGGEFWVRTRFSGRRSVGSWWSRGPCLRCARRKWSSTCQSRGMPCSRPRLRCHSHRLQSPGSCPGGLCSIPDETGNENFWLILLLQVQPNWLSLNVRDYENTLVKKLAANKLFEPFVRVDTFDGLKLDNTFNYRISSWIMYEWICIRTNCSTIDCSLFNTKVVFF